METAALEARVKRLEGWIRALLVAALLGAVSTVGLALHRPRLAPNATAPQQLVSEDGRTTLTLKGERLFFERDGKREVVLSADGTTTGLVVQTADERARVILSPEGLAFFRDGKPSVSVQSALDEKVCGMSIHDATGRVRGIFSMGVDGAPLLRIEGSTDEIVSQLTVSDDHQRLALTRGKGETAVSLSNGQEWGGCFAGRNGAMALLSMDVEGEPTLWLERDDGVCFAASADTETGVEPKLEQPKTE